MLTPPNPTERLVIQAEAWASSAATALDEIGIATGATCADLGCGPLGILDLLSRRVGRRGRVVGVDHHPGHLLAAMGLASDRKLPNVRLVGSDVVHTGLPPRSFDLVHARLVCQETGAAPLLKEMTRLVRPGGTVFLEEPGLEPWKIDPPPARFVELAPAVARVFLPRKRSTGPFLEGHLRRHGLVSIEIRQARLEIAGGQPYATMPLFALAGAASKLLSEQAIGRAALETLSDALEVAARDAGVRHRAFPLWQVWGCKPS